MDTKKLREGLIDIGLAHGLDISSSFVENGNVFTLDEAYKTLSYSIGLDKNEFDKITSEFIELFNELGIEYKFREVKRNGIQFVQVIDLII